MKYCSRCGKELVDDAIICTNCGSACDPAMNAAFGNNVPKDTDEISVGLCVLAFFFPIFGIIYWPVRHRYTPKRARAIGITAIVSYAINFISIILMYAYAGATSFMNYLF